MNAPTVVVIALVPLIAWRLYARVRRLVGRQRSRAWRHWVAVLAFPLLAAMLALGAAPRADAAPALGALAAGLAVGIALGVWGLRLTRFERTEQGWFYTPSAHIGIALSALLVGRIGWRIAELQMHGAAPDAGHFAANPLTFAVFGTVAGYYASYSAGLLRWRARAAKAAAGA